jgi:hypothetical protein
LEPQEELLASVVERVLLRDDGRALGPRTEHDFNDGIRWAVDLTYDGATPPVALELTSVQDDWFLSTRSAVVKLADRLSRLAIDEGLGGWEVIVWDHVKMRDIEKVLARVLRDGDSIDVDGYTSDDLLSWRQAGDLDSKMDLHRRLSQAGIARVRRRSGRQDVSVSTGGKHVGVWSGLADLQAIVDSNAPKLAVTGLEGHLAVGIGRYRVSTSPEATSVPTLPGAVDRLWLVRLWRPRGAGYEVWSAARNDQNWKVHDLVA